jgi:hypothetical protein
MHLIMQFQIHSLQAPKCDSADPLQLLEEYRCCCQRELFGYLLHIYSCHPSDTSVWLILMPLLLRPRPHSLKHTQRDENPFYTFIFHREESMKPFNFNIQWAAIIRRSNLYRNGSLLKFFIITCNPSDIVGQHSEKLKCWIEFNLLKPQLSEILNEFYDIKVYFK